jgi:hypothetical protein
VSNLRRALLAAYSLLLILSAVSLDALAWNSSKKLDVHTGSFELQAFISGTTTAKWGFTALMAAVVLIGIVTLLLALVSPNESWGRGSFRVRQPGGERVELPLARVEQALRGELERLPGVLSAAPRIRYQDGAIDSFVSALVEPHVSVPHVTNAITNTTMAALREQVGVSAVRAPVIKLDVARPSTGAALPPPETALEAPRDD